MREGERGILERGLVSTRRFRSLSFIAGQIGRVGDTKRLRKESATSGVKG